MTIDISQLNVNRIDRVLNAESLDQATEMGLIDRLIDKIFYAGAKKEAITQLFELIRSKDSGTASQMRSFLDMRSLIVPAQRDKLALELFEHPDGSYDYKLLLDGQVVAERQGILSDDTHNISALRHAKNAIEVDDFLMRLQDFHPKAISLVQRSDRFLVEQGRVGDCYALAVMIGVMSNPDFHGKMESLAKITDEGNLRLTFDADPKALIGQAADISGVSSRHADAISEATLDTIYSHESFRTMLGGKGYIFQKNETTGVFFVDVTPERLKEIAATKISAATNSLVVNIMEHFVGNCIPGLVEVPNLTSEEMDELRKLVPEGSSTKQVDDFLRYYQNDVKLDFPADRMSILAHDDVDVMVDEFLVAMRGANYDPLVANLLGYRAGREFWLSSEQNNDISPALRDFKNKGHLLDQGVKNGFVYVGMRYGKADKNGRFHGGHALALKDVVFKSDGKAEGVFLVNPWGNKREPEYYSIEDLKKRDAGFKEYFLPDRSIYNEAVPLGEIDDAKNKTKYVFFDGV